MRWLLLLALVAFPSISRAEPPTSFVSAKDAAVDLWWEIGPVSFYCQCPYRPATTEEKMIRSGNLWVVGSVRGYRAKDLITSSGNRAGRLYTGRRARPSRVWRFKIPG